MAKELLVGAAEIMGDDEFAVELMGDPPFEVELMGEPPFEVELMGDDPFGVELIGGDGDGLDESAVMDVISKKDRASDAYDAAMNGETFVGRRLSRRSTSNTPRKYPFYFLNSGIQFVAEAKNTMAHPTDSAMTMAINFLQQKIPDWTGWKYVGLDSADTPSFQGFKNQKSRLVAIYREGGTSKGKLKTTSPQNLRVAGDSDTGWSLTKGLKALNPFSGGGGSTSITIDMKEKGAEAAEQIKKKYPESKAIKLLKYLPGKKHPFNHAGHRTFMWDRMPTWKFLLITNNNKTKRVSVRFNIPGGQKWEVGSSLSGIGESDAAALAVGIPLTLAAGYGIYKLAGAGGPSTPGDPWLYKLNPAFWFKTAAERKYINIEKSRGKRNVELDAELDAAKKAYYTSSAASQKEGQISEIDQSLQAQKNPAPPSPTVAMKGTTEIMGILGSFTDSDRAKVESTLKKLGINAQSETIFNPRETDFINETIWLPLSKQFPGESIVDRAKIGNGRLAFYTFAEKNKLIFSNPDRPLTTGQNSHFILSTIGGKPHTHEFNAPDDNPTIIKAEAEKSRQREIKWLSNTTGKGNSSMKGATEIMGKTSFVGAAMPPQAQQILLAVATNNAPILGAIARGTGLAAKKMWNAADVDKMAQQFLQASMKKSGTVPNATDAGLARDAIKLWAQKSGIQIMTTAVSGDEVGLSWWQIPAAPVLGTLWAGKKIGQGVWSATKWVGRGLGIGGGKKKTPLQKRQAALKAAALQKAAAEKRILAAEKKHEAAISEREEEKDVATAEAAAADAEAAANEAEAIAIQADAEKDVPGVAQALEGWTVIGHLPPAMVGKGALAAASNTKVGAKIRLGAATARAVRVSGEARRTLIGIAEKAKNGDKAALAQLQTIQAGAIADAQKQVALVKDAHRKRGLAERLKMRVQKLLKNPVTFTAVSGDDNFPRIARTTQPFSAARTAPFLRPSKTSSGDDINFPRIARTTQPFSAARTAPFLRPSKTASGNDINFPRIARTTQPFSAGKTAPFLRPSKTASGGDALPPPVPGEPVDLSVTVSAAANTMGVPPAVAMSVVAAAKSGSKAARKEIDDAAAVYLAAQKGDPEAKAQIEAVQKDAKSGYAPALQKAAVLAAAVGTIKGRKQYATRIAAKKAAKKNGKAPAVATAPAAAAPAAPSGFSLLTFSAS